MKLVSAFFPKNVIVKMVIISLHYKETNKTVLFTLLLQKSSSTIKLGKLKSNLKSFLK